MATPHIGAEKGDIAEKILLPGDPLRARFIAENYLEAPVAFNSVRNMLGYTGTYRGEPVSVMGTGYTIAIDLCLRTDPRVWREAFDSRGFGGGVAEGFEAVRYRTGPRRLHGFERSLSVRLEGNLLGHCLMEFAGKGGRNCKRTGEDGACGKCLFHGCLL